MAERMGCYTGQILRVNLTSGKVEKEPIPVEVLRKFIGGKGLSAYYLFRELKPGVNPLGPENKLLFMTGPLTGTIAPVPNRFNVAAKSPLTGTWSDGQCGGSWGPELKFAGYDGIIIEGKSETPVYLHIRDEEASLLSAEDIWGADTFSTERILKEKHFSGRMPRVASIGPAGERMALISNIISEVRAVGRGGMGAVMGSKKLKAIVVSGAKYKPEDFAADKTAMREAVRRSIISLSSDEDTSPNVKPTTPRGSLSLYGSARIVGDINAAGGWPTRNFQTGIFEKASEISGQAYADKLWIPRNAPGTRPCYRCQILCAHVSIIKSGKYAGTLDEGPEYETVWSFGAQCGVSDREAIARADYLSDYYGLDTISLGNTIGFLMECYEKGLITREDTDGLELTFGNADAMVKLVEMAGAGTGKIGILASNGVKRASEQIGKGSEKFAMHVKGLEMPAYEPRAAFGMGLGYAICDRGACHLHAWTAGDEMLQPPAVDPITTKGKARSVKDLSEEVAIAYDSAGTCLFQAFGIGGLEEIVDIINAATGFGFKDVDELRKAGERIINLTRCFNVREGFLRKDDTLPHRCLKEPLPEGPCKGATVKLDEMLDEYYELCGWDSEGRPTKEKLEELGLDFAAKEIYNSTV